MKIILFVISLLLTSSCLPDPAKTVKKKEVIEQMVGQIEKKFPSVPTVTRGDLSELDDYLLVDIREKKEQNVSMIPGSITQEEFEKNPEKYKGKKIITYCTIGYRSSEYAEKIRKKGFKAYNLRGSLLTWAHEGGQFVDKMGAKTKKVHVYGKPWSLLPEGFEAITE